LEVVECDFGGSYVDFTVAVVVTVVGKWDWPEEFDDRHPALDAGVQDFNVGGHINPIDLI
jgi:hypothetical protein